MEAWEAYAAWRDLSRESERTTPLLRPGWAYASASADRSKVFLSTGESLACFESLKASGARFLTPFLCGRPFQPARTKSSLDPGSCQNQPWPRILLSTHFMDEAQWRGKVVKSSRDAARVLPQPETHSFELGACFLADQRNPLNWDSYTL